MFMKKIVAATAIGLVALSSAASAGGLAPAIEEPIVAVAPAPAGSLGGLGAAGATVAAIGAIGVLALILDDDDDNDDDSSATTTAGAVVN
ncbi:hypothetical protein OCGS_0294 [Oceaniovalibus guishaninsula JLT2003]|uniref:Uncharacterized protein n=1 Tax=Oceaniovalibus guishaninsula JLT2003 TaxID=1231392 RepID=K2HGV7_9RHOB|nr:hypothetical protein [Oceaniovalibus guishaninsula]EKE45677.1 hypothetical protein OCGS_0294 [Oceaniovalibus guishaninsula JLT2003]